MTMCSCQNTQSHCFVTCNLLALQLQLQLGITNIFLFESSSWMLLCTSTQYTAGSNALWGSVPSSWASMAALEDLELDYNCGLCGSLPTFAMQVITTSLLNSRAVRTAALV